MKRSEMIKKMVSVLEETAHCSNELKAKAILAMQTEAQMLPPRAIVEVRSTMTDDDGDVLFDEMVKVPAYEWEKE